MNTTPGGIFVAHADHGLGVKHLSLIDSALASWDGKSLIKKLVILPPDCESLMSALYGPLVGDELICDDSPDVIWEARGNRELKSKLVDRPHRPVRSMVVVAGPGRDEGIVYTAYGSSLIAPQERGDPYLSDADRPLAEAFWSAHALAV
jgi:hypothetical protein